MLVKEKNGAKGKIYDKLSGWREAANAAALRVYASFSPEGRRRLQDPPQP